MERQLQPLISLGIFLIENYYIDAGADWVWRGLVSGLAGAFSVSLSAGRSADERDVKVLVTF